MHVWHSLIIFEHDLQAILAEFGKVFDPHCEQVTTPLLSLQLLHEGIKVSQVTQLCLFEARNLEFPHALQKIPLIFLEHEVQSAIAAEHMARGESTLIVANNEHALDVVGEKPALKFTHRFDTETGADGGFILVSNDGGILYDDVKDKWLRNGYNSDIQYGTFAIPLLEAYSGSTNEEWITSYLDLSDYAGQEIHVRFRFGTDDNTGVTAPFPGWYVDDLELVDLQTYESVACISSDNSAVDQCTPTIEVFVGSDQELDTSVEELDGFDISVSPNPASEYLSVGLSAEQNTPAQLLLTSIDGTIVKSMNLVVGTNQSVRTINTSELTAGMYLVQVKTETGLTTKKVVIQ